MSRRLPDRDSTTTPTPETRDAHWSISQRVLAWLLLVTGAVVAVVSLFSPQPGAMATAGGLIAAGQLTLRLKHRRGGGADNG